MIESLKTRGKILGLAMGEVVVAQLDQIPIPNYRFLADLTPTVETLDQVKIFTI